MSGESDEKDPHQFDRQAIKRERAAWPAAAACLIVDPPHQLDQNAGPDSQDKVEQQVAFELCPLELPTPGKDSRDYHGKR